MFLRFTGISRVGWPIVLTWFFTIMHIIVSVFLVLVVLLQTGKRADLAGAFGGGGSQTAFGARGAATVLTKATTAAAVAFMVTSLALSIVSSHARRESGSALENVDEAAIEAEAPAPPVLPATGTPPPATSDDPGEGQPAPDAGGQDRDGS